MNLWDLFMNIILDFIEKRREERVIEVYKYVENKLF